MFSNNFNLEDTLPAIDVQIITAYALLQYALPFVDWKFQDGSWNGENRR